MSFVFSVFPLPFLNFVPSLSLLSSWAISVFVYVYLGEVNNPRLLSIADDASRKFLNKWFTPVKRELL